MDVMELILHTDDFLTKLVEANITLTYFILFSIIFFESAFLLFFYLPGDGLLFFVGVISAVTQLDILIVIPLLIAAAATGYLVNYKLGMWSGNWLLTRNWRYFRSFYKNAHDFMDLHGTKAIIVGRFFPVVRTFLPFVAGMVAMNHKKFILHTCLGAVIWVLFFTLTGHFVGAIPWVKDNYGMLFLGLVIITFLPLLYSFFRAVLKKIVPLLNKKKQ